MPLGAIYHRELAAPREPERAAPRGGGGIAAFRTWARADKDEPAAVCSISRSAIWLVPVTRALV